MKFLYSAISASMLGLFATASSHIMFSCPSGYQILESDVLAAARNIDPKAKIYESSASSTGDAQYKFQLGVETYNNVLYLFSAIIYSRDMTVRVLQTGYKSRKEKYCDLIEVGDV
ncbi:BgTH12-03401 [Blumeria graminis f. sp. triticale]|uniref:BgtE-5880 n=3 Tax=Blumeria graminis TaxID=34373 RepID=A0A381L233_BLUGR|nr:BgTH12-03401 [Blumeria graminis f. sp. triticale]VCU39404.1 BgtE-5880 [Blumeria graminis f. sp. tritici]